MIGSWVTCGCVSILLLSLDSTSRFCSPIGHFLLLGILLPWLYFLAVLAYRRMSVRYVLSTQRFLHERGFLRRVSDRIELLDVDDITFEQSLWERLVGFGTLRIASHDRTNPELTLPGIENIKHVASLFDDARLADAAAADCTSSRSSKTISRCRLCFSITKRAARQPFTGQSSS